MGREKARTAVYALAGVYLLYMAWEMLHQLDTMEENKGMFIGFIIFFAIAGAAMVGLGIWGTYRGMKKGAENNKAAEPEDAVAEENGEATDAKVTDTESTDAEKDTEAMDAEMADSEVTNAEAECTVEAEER